MHLEEKFPESAAFSLSLVVLFLLLLLLLLLQKFQRRQSFVIYLLSHSAEQLSPFTGLRSVLVFVCNPSIVD